MHWEIAFKEKKCHIYVIEYMPYNGHSIDRRFTTKTTEDEFPNTYTLLIKMGIWGRHADDRVAFGNTGALKEVALILSDGDCAVGVTACPQ